MDGECGGLRRRSAVASAATAEPLPDRLTPVDDHRAVEVPGRGPRCGFSLLVACAPTLDDVSFTVTWHGWRQWLARGGTDTLLLLLFTFLALTTRLVSLAQPDSIAYVCAFACVCVFVREVVAFKFSATSFTGGMRRTLASLQTSTSTVGSTSTCIRR
jgi:hypothetical protein